MAPEAIARAAQQEIDRLHNEYLACLRAQNASVEANDPPDTYRQFVIAARDKARQLHQAVENAIVQSEIVGAHQSELWAKDLAATAFNVLDAIPDYFERSDYACKTLGENPPRPSANAFYAMQSAVVAYHPDQVPQLLEKFRALGLPIRGFTNPARMNTRYSRTEFYIMFGTGVAFILLMLAIALFHRDLNNFNIWVFKGITALAVAIVAGIALGGAISVEGKVGKNVIRATGAFAVFFLVLYVNPPALVVNAVKASDSSPAMSTPGRP